MITLAARDFVPTQAVDPSRLTVDEYLAEVEWLVPPTGEAFDEYLAETVPELLAAGGRLEAALSPDAWECRDWTNCPMAAAFGVITLKAATCGVLALEQTPRLLWPRIMQFVVLYDSGKISRTAALTACRKKGLLA